MWGHITNFRWIFLAIKTILEIHFLNNILLRLILVQMTNQLNTVNRWVGQTVNDYTGTCSDIPFQTPTATSMALLFSAYTQSLLVKICLFHGKQHPQHNKWGNFSHVLGATAELHANVLMIFMPPWAMC